jgi:hypothetical protein
MIGLGADNVDHSLKKLLHILQVHHPTYDAYTFPWILGCHVCLLHGRVAEEKG